jgi:hypothetical protein
MTNPLTINKFPPLYPLTISVNKGSHHWKEKNNDGARNALKLKIQMTYFTFG